MDNSKVYSGEHYTILGDAPADRCIDAGRRVAKIPAPKVDADTKRKQAERIREINRLMRAAAAFARGKSAG